jgi:tripartite-type tricarboxylate transporter receptor subunit TctC
VSAQAVIAMTLACCAGGAGAQGASAYPQRNVQVVVPYTPGTGADIVARALGPRLAELWKVAVITDNRPGATGIIGTDYVAGLGRDIDDVEQVRVYRLRKPGGLP